jgi:hypothetical protein
LGLVIYELVTGKRLFKRENDLATLNAILSDPIPLPSSLRPEVESELDEIVLKCLARDPVDRYQSCAELAADLSVFLLRRNYARSTGVVPYLKSSFGEERMQSKLRIAQGVLDPEEGSAGSTPDWLVRGSADLSPVRSDGRGINTPGRATPGRTPSTARDRPGTAPRTPAPSSRPGSRPVRMPTRPEMLVAADNVPTNVAKSDLIPRPVQAGRGKLIAAGMGIAVVGILVFVFSGRRSGEGSVDPLPLPTGPSSVQTAKPSVTSSPAVPPTPGSAGLQVGGVRLDGLPAGAKVRIDGSGIPSPNSEQYLPIGKHQVIVEAKGFLPFESEVTLVVGEVKVVAVSMKPRPVEPKGTVEINCVPWCQISVDGKDTGKVSPTTLSLSVGSHTLFLANPPAGLAKKLTVKVNLGQTVRQVVKLEE